ncbi:hypothetical protein EU537_10860 [Candidatus Thorarchaeota archaeon]|nr:MAG: hypothetical protein EU537_10860 [Candidatus Thorarchaeota archaeon]
MLQITFESSFIYLSIVFIAFGLLSFGWLGVHVEHARHFSKIKAALALIVGSLFIGFGIHFLLLYTGA